MKKTVIKMTLTGLLFTGSLLISCEKSTYLDKQPSGELTEEQVWSSWSNTVYFYTDTYNFLRNGLARFNSSWMDEATDLAEASRSSAGVRSSFNVGNFYASGGSPEIVDTWSHYYTGIRKVNLFLAHVDNVPFGTEVTSAVGEATRTRMKAEMRFFRAYFYWELCLRYGAIPIITEAIDPGQDITEVLASYPRPASVGTCFEWIVAELNNCYGDLTADTDLSTADYGLVTKGVNLALLSRIKLYLASPYYASLGLYSWQDAADAAEIFIENWGNGIRYALYQNTADYSKAYQNAINTRAVDGNKESIFWKNAPVGDWWQDESPVGFGGYGGLCPSQTLVDMYDMADGTSPFSSYDASGAPNYDVNGNPTINSSSSYQEQNPYINRDPRFYSTVLYNGAQWWSRNMETTVNGTDNPKGNAYKTTTGYYNRKYHDDSQTSYLDNSKTMYRNWIFIRYAEILLNYAEALNEAQGPSNRVFEVLQQLRDRVGLTAKLSARADLQSKEALRNFIRKERTIELAFEDHRWWDVRRWQVADQAIGRPIYGINITKASDGTLTYIRQVVQERVFQDRFYLYPIPEAEIWKTGWTNNSGWQ
ncbi:RagB/SusD family nutrient uptake outer membrane protein [Sphingobacterium sp. LRF_L2]|uniref:RagB/SusD family nutrient uptake outer membrane protein n=1 Tax=Sphingobacterium sp. LRF_L2 TaxID=3369421 RepID=UPI003F5ECC3F